MNKEKKAFNCKLITSINSRKRLLFPLSPLGIIFPCCSTGRWTHSQCTTLTILQSYIKNPKSELHLCHAKYTLTEFLCLRDLGEAGLPQELGRCSVYSQHPEWKILAGFTHRILNPQKTWPQNCSKSPLSVLPCISTQWQWKSLEHCVFLI